MNDDKKSVAYELIEHFIQLSDTEHKRKDIVILVMVVLLVVSNFIWLGVRSYERKMMDDKVYEAIQMHYGVDD